MVEKSLPILKAAATKNPKTIPAKFIVDLEKALKSR